MCWDICQLDINSHPVPKVALELNHFSFPDTRCLRQILSFHRIQQILVRSANSTCRERAIINVTILHSYQPLQILRLLFFFFIISAIFALSNVATSALRKENQQLHKTGCYREVKADNPPFLSVSEDIIQTHAGTKPAERGWRTAGIWLQRDRIVFVRFQMWIY